ncbi:hypothetical protein HYH02_006253 [Chlamydomonas schloesseri]|uniref:Coenzyme Q-binding protein COQ10 START domain-containing protein n=1 Tax=Chlamydomonas schloesseri TaxID=2026947 RepID=A0A835WLC7_9CHLO|nr:hypothetical protein HYH02_006253 [Chlamydomonas schloesseri]|eukprot:KAG2448905.1 hypothetical protein HYH02_006253 [Chlamydomonas schloesseri]
MPGIIKSLHAVSHASHDDDVELDLGEQELERGKLRPEVVFVSLVDGKYTVQGRLLLRAPASEVYELLTDYAGCHTVFSNIAASQVLTGPDGGKQVEQLCRWKFLAFSGTFKVQLGVVEDTAARTLLFNLVQSSFMSDFEGRWAVAPAAPPPGAAPAPAGEQWCEVQHTLSVVPAVPVPAPVAFYTRSIFVKQVEGILLDLQRGLPRWRAERS